MIKQPTTREEAKAWAEDLFKSGFCQDCESAEQVLYKILYGMELGVGVMASIHGIYIQENSKKDKSGNFAGKIRKPSLTAPLMSTIINASGKYELVTKTFTHDVSEIEIRRNGQPIRVASFTKEDAIKAQLTTGANSHNYSKYSRNMLHHRNISNIAKTDCAECFGGQPVYTPEELGMKVDGEGIPSNQDEDQSVCLDMRTYINEELADRGQPPVDELKARAKAEKAAAKAAKSATARTESSNVVTTAEASSATEQPIGEQQPAKPKLTVVVNEQDRPGAQHVVEIVQAGGASGWSRDQINNFLQKYLLDNKVCTEETLPRFKEFWTMADFDAILAHVRNPANKPKAAA